MHPYMNTEAAIRHNQEINAKQRETNVGMVYDAEYEDITGEIKSVRQITNGEER
jgi:hypothetical protein